MSAELIDGFMNYLAHERLLSKSTQTSYKSDIRKLIALSDPCQMTYDDLRNHVSGFSKEGLKVATITRKVAAYRIFWKFLVLEKRADENIAERLRIPRRKRRIPFYLSEADLRKFVTTPDPDRRHWLAWKTLAWLGLRRSEILNLKVGDLHFDRHEIMILHAKGDKDRRVPMPDKLIEEYRWAAENRKAEDYLFNGPMGGRWNVKAIQFQFKQHLLRCGLTDKRITLHTLRHTFITWMANRGARDVHIQAITGIADPKTLMVYRHSDPEALTSAYQLFPLNTESP